MAFINKGSLGEADQVQAPNEWSGLGSLIGMGGEDANSAARRQMFLNGFRTQVGTPPQFGQGVQEAANQGFRNEMATREEQRQIAQQEAAAAETNATIQWLQSSYPDLAPLYKANPNAVIQEAIRRQQGQQPQSLMNAGGGYIFDPNTREWLSPPQTGASQSLTDTQRNLMFRAEQAGLQPGTPEYQQFMMSGGTGGTSLSVDPATGSVSFQQGFSAKPLTEGQSKDAVYATRAAGSLPLIDKYGTALTSAVEHGMGMDPTGVVRGNQSPEFQMARQAGDEFLQAILRKDTGAAITSQEMAEYGRTYLPQPGDGPEVLTQKAASRQRALAALQAGMAPQAILNMEMALQMTGSPPAISSPEQYNALPSGAHYVAPDGQIRTKK